MTEKEIKLLEIAKEVIELNKNSNLSLKLTGSLMLAHMGVNKRREANDIDFLVDENEVIADEYSDRCPKVPKGFIMDYEGSRSCPTAIKFTNGEISIDFLSSWEGSDFYDGILCSDVGYLIQAKEMIIRQTIHAETAIKHREDLEYMYEHNEDI